MPLHQVYVTRHFLFALVSILSLFLFLVSSSLFYLLFLFFFTLSLCPYFFFLYSFFHCFFFSSLLLLFVYFVFLSLCLRPFIWLSVRIYFKLQFLRFFSYFYSSLEDISSQQNSWQMQKQPLSRFFFPICVFDLIFPFFLSLSFSFFLLILQLFFTFFPLLFNYLLALPLTFLTIFLLFL